MIQSGSPLQKVLRTLLYRISGSTATNIRNVVFWDIDGYRHFGRTHSVHPHDGNDESSKFLPNFGIHPSYYTVLLPGRAQHEKYV
jgi:hypothetical protein